jgi:hypothetical protein
MAEPDLREVLRALERHGVRYVVIGAQAAVARGAPILTEDIDVTPASDAANLGRLAAALRELEARLRSPSDPGGVSFPIDAKMLGTAQSWTLTTRHGDLDLVFLPSGTAGYDDLRRGASLERLADDLTVHVASLADVIRCKEAAGRAKDLMQLPILRLTLEETRRRERGGAS